MSKSILAENDEIIQFMQKIILNFRFSRPKGWRNFSNFKFGNFTALEMSRRALNLKFALQKWDLDDSQSHANVRVEF